MGILASVAALPSLFCCACQSAMCACSMISCCCQANTGVSFTGAKLMYVLLLGMSTVLAFILKFTGADWSQDYGPFSVSIGCTNTSYKTGYDYSMYGASAQGYCAGDAAVYRISLSLSLFFLFMAGFGSLGEGMFKGFWGFKLFLYAGAMIGCFFIPEIFFANGVFQGIARFVSIIFLVLQVLILIDFGYVWNEQWVAHAYAAAPNSDEPSSKGWLIGILFCAVGMTVGWIAWFIVLYIFYGGSVPVCSGSQGYISVSLILVIISNFVSLFRDRLVGVPGAVLPAAVVSLYVVYLTWSGLQSNPEKQCRPSVGTNSAAGVAVSILIAALSLMWTSFRATKQTENLMKGDNQSEKETTPLVDAKDPNSQLYRVDDGGKTKNVSDLESNKAAKKEEEAKGAETKSVEAASESVPLFFLLMIAAALYMGMTLTNWGEPSSDINGQTGNASMWVKLSVAWVSGVLFIWTLVAPAVCKNRTFS